jgi:Fe-S oxidoreductase
MGNRWLGWAMPPFTIVHAIEFYHDLIKEGRIKIASKYEQAHHPARPVQRGRGAGLYEKARYVAHAMCENVIEMHPNREHNYCCCAGGGVINCGPHTK